MYGITFVAKTSLGNLIVDATWEPILDSSWRGAWCVDAAIDTNGNDVFGLLSADEQVALEDAAINISDNYKNVRLEY